MNTIKNSKYNKKSLWLSAILNMIFCPSVTPTESLIILPNKLIAIRCPYFPASASSKLTRMKSIKILNSVDLPTINQDKANKLRKYSLKPTTGNRCYTWNFSKSEKHPKLTRSSRWWKRRSKQKELLTFFSFQSVSKPIQNPTPLSHSITNLTILWSGIYAITRFLSIIWENYRFPWKSYKIPTVKFTRSLERFLFGNVPKFNSLMFTLGSWLSWNSSKTCPLFKEIGWCNK